LPERHSVDFRLRDVAASRPGGLLNQDTFCWGTLKGVGKVYVQVVVKVLCSLAFAKVCATKMLSPLPTCSATDNDLSAALHGNLEAGAPPDLPSQPVELAPETRLVRFGTVDRLPTLEECTKPANQLSLREYPQVAADHPDPWPIIRHPSRPQ